MNVSHWLEDEWPFEEDASELSRLVRDVYQRLLWSVCLYDHLAFTWMCPMRVLPFATGDKVKLTERFAATLKRNNYSKVDWHNRRGVVLCCGEDQVSVMWSGRLSKDYLPHRAVELCDGQRV